MRKVGLHVRTSICSLSPCQHRFPQKYERA
jgi:hypothetical protein